MPQTARQTQKTWAGRKVRDHDKERGRATVLYEAACQDPAHNLALHPIFFETALSPDVYSNMGWTMRCPACRQAEKEASGKSRALPLEKKARAGALRMREGSPVQPATPPRPMDGNIQRWVPSRKSSRRVGG